MSTDTPHGNERSADEPPAHYRQSDLDAYYVSEFEAALIRFTISCSLLAGLVALMVARGGSLEFAILATSIGAAIVMVHKGQLEDPTA